MMAQGGQPCLPYFRVNSYFYSSTSERHVNFDLHQMSLSELISAVTVRGLEEPSPAVGNLVEALRRPSSSSLQSPPDPGNAVLGVR